MCTYCTDDMRNFKLMSLSLSKSGSGLPYLKKLKLRASSPNVLNLKKWNASLKKKNAKWEMWDVQSRTWNGEWGMRNAECGMQNAGC